MKKYIKIIAIFVVLSLGFISCKAPCGCNGHGYGAIKNINNQVEQLV